MALPLEFGQCHGGNPHMTGREANPKVSAFRRWLDRQPKRRRDHRDRIARDFDVANVLGAIALAILVLGIVGFGIYRLITGEF